MKKDFTNKFSTYQNIVGLLDSRSEVYAGYPVATAAVEDFRNILEDIKTIGEKTDFDYSNLTSKKQKIKHDMAEVVSTMAAAVSIFAREIKDSDLEAISSTTYSDVFRSRDFEALELARGFQTLVQKYSESLKDFMISEGDLNELAGVISEFDKVYVKKEEAYSESVMDTQRLMLLFRKADAILREKIDMVVKKLKRVNLDFYNSYFQARVIVDL